MNKDKSDRERLDLAMMSISCVFAEMSLRNKNFAEFCFMGSYHEITQNYLLDVIGNEIAENAEDLSISLAAYFSDIKPEALQPFMTKIRTPNVFYFFHLILQSLQQDFVYISFFKLLITVRISS